MARFQGDLPERSRRFAQSLIPLVRSFPNENAGWIIGKHLLKSGTSIGANVHEADVALTDADFAHCCSIARKEAAETQYWLILNRDAELGDQEQIDSAIQEARELLLILSTIVKTTQTRSKRNN